MVGDNDKIKPITYLVKRTLLQTGWNKFEAKIGCTAVLDDLLNRNCV
jgi:hypothetical protein